MLAAGDPAPDFDAPTADGGRLRLSELRGRSVVLYFYPKANSPGCTRESKEFAQRYARLRASGFEVVGVSVDDAAAQRRFRDRCALPFPMVPDRSREISERYGVLGAFGWARRITFIIGEDGRIRQVVSSVLPGAHATAVEEELLAAGADAPRPGAGDGTDGPH